VKRALPFFVIACGSTTPPTTAHVEPLATASASASSSAPAVSPVADDKHAVFAPDPAGPFATTPRALAAPAGPRGIVQLVGTIGKMCVLRASGEIACIESGEAWKREPVTDATFIAMQNDLMCAVKKSGEVACWGTVNDAWGFQRTPKNVPKIAAATRTTVATASACMLGRDGHVGCVGMDSGLGAGPIGKDRTFDPVEPLGLHDVVDLFEGRFDACARERSGAVKCWGVAEHGVLGPFGTTPNGPVELVGIRGATDASFAESYACAVLSDGVVACWGDHYGKNDDDPKGAHDFQRIGGVSDAVSVVAGVQATCILRKTGNVVCLGYDHEGWLGDGGDRPRWGVTDDTVIPVYPEDVDTRAAGGPPPPQRLRKRPPGARPTKLMNVVGLADAVAIAEYGYGICALKKTGALACWGTHLPGTKIDRSNVAHDVPNPP
jgi:hypothetical protein